MTAKTTASLKESQMQWKDVIDSQYYEVSDTGLIRNKRTKRILVPSENGHGLPKVILSEDGDKTYKTVARIVADAYLDEPEEGDVIFYMDDTRSNTAASNLRWRPRWYAQEWAHQQKRTAPMRNWRIEMFAVDGPRIYDNSLECANQTYGIERYVVLACGRGSIYNHATYEWIKE
jgi:hypothetical protein